MAEERVQRRLAAILAADVVGYSRLMEADEEGTLRRLQGDLRRLVAPTIAAHHGRLVKTTGDGLLAEFASVVDAVRCAVAIQRGEEERNADLPEVRRIAFRIGINLGDVIAENDDLFGDGVNVAARLESLAKAGGVLLSGTAYDQLKKNVDVGFEYLGHQRVKNIAEPVRVYRVLTDPAALGRTISAGVFPKHFRRWAVPLMIAAMVAGAGMAWWQPWAPTLAPASVERMALPLPDKPSIVVLPFANMSGDPQQEYFADGITENLTTDLSSLAGLFVIARNTAFIYKGKTVTPAQVAEELGVRYLVEGSVQRAGETVRINAQLIDAVSGGHEWAGRFDGSLADIFALQDKVTGAVVSALKLRLSAGEQQALGQHETDVPAAYDEFMRGWEHYRRTTPEDFAKAIPRFEQAIALDPTYARAHAALAMVYFRSYDQGWTGSLGQSASETYELTRRHLLEAEKRPTSTSHQVAGNIARTRGWYDAAHEEFKAAIALDPNDPWSYAYMAYVLIYAGRHDEAAVAIETAMRLDPNYPPVFVYYRGLTQFGLNRLEEAARSMEDVIRLSPDDPWPQLYLAACYASLGRTEEAAAVIAAYDAVRIRQGGIPFVTEDLYLATFNRFTLLIPPETNRLLAGLARMGAPNNFDSDLFKDQKLNAAEVGALFFGHRVHGRTFQTGREHGATVSADGVAVMFGDWGSGAGSARLDGDRLCFVWESTTNCGSVFRNVGGMRAKENEFIWYSTQSGAFPFSPVE